MAMDENARFLALHRRTHGFEQAFDHIRKMRGVGEVFLVPDTRDDVFGAADDRHVLVSNAGVDQ